LLIINIGGRCETSEHRWVKKSLGNTVLKGSAPVIGRYPYRPLAELYMTRWRILKCEKKPKRRVLCACQGKSTGLYKWCKCHVTSFTLPTLYYYYTHMRDEDIYTYFLFSIPQVKHGRTARNVRDLWPS